MKKQILCVLAAAFCACNLWAQSAEFSGKGVVVFEPSVNGRADSWIPEFVQGIVNTNFQKYSDMKVIDRQNIEKVKKEQRLSEGLEYTDEGQIEIGKLLNARYIVTMKVIKKESDYYIEYKITDTETSEICGARKNESCAEAELKNGIAVNADCRELLLAIGVKEDKLKDLTKENLQKHKAEELASKQRQERKMRASVKNSKDYQNDFPCDAARIGAGILISPDYTGWNVAAFADLFWLLENPLGLELGPKYMFTSSFDSDFWLHSVLLQLGYRRKLNDWLAIFVFASGGVGILKTNSLGDASGFDVEGKEVTKAGFGGQVGLALDFAIARHAKAHVEYSFNYICPAVGTGDIISVGFAFGPRN